MSRWSKFLGIFQPSDLLKKKFRKYQQKRKDTYYEGPKPPPRLVEEIKLFAIMNPLATPTEWERFTVGITTSAYKDGFIRGYEWLERGWDCKPSEEDERVAEAMQHDWSLADSHPRYDRLLKTGYLPNDPLAGYSYEQRKEFMEQLTNAERSPYPVHINLDAYRDKPKETEES